MDLSMMASVENYDTSQTHLAHLSSITPPSSSLSTTPPSSSSNTHQLELMRTNLLVDHTHIIWELLCQPKSSSESRRRIDIVLDNAGLELFSDFCFADWLLKVGLADQVFFHFKQMPWFVSDAMIKDFESTLRMMSASESPVLKSLSNAWQDSVRDGSFVLVDHPFWTTCYEYASMFNMASDLYITLCESHLVIFKGDLHYRKLLADRNWLYTECFNVALGGFEPTNLCTLRTLKADLVTGLSPGVAAKAASQSKDWMVAGQFAVCQVNKKK